MSDAILNNRGGSRPGFGELADFIRSLTRGTVTLPSCCGVQRAVSFEGVDGEQLHARLLDRGILSPRVLAERALADLDAAAEASSLGLSIDQVIALYGSALERLDPIQRQELTDRVRAPKGKGQLRGDHPLVLKTLRAIGADQRLLTTERLREWLERERLWAFLPRGPRRAVDHRPKLGPARDQGGRPTCTSFGSTVVAEALEYLRDCRPGPRDFAEEFLWWYSKNGALITAGGYDGRVALYHYEKNGVCGEELLPYSGQQINSNHAHVPVSDAAIDRARDFRQPPMVMLPERDVAVVKQVLETGRCVSFGSDTYDWNTGTGLVGFPDPLDSRGVGGGHCTTVIGYIDRDDLPAHFEGGFFIVRNSWGGAGSTSHVMGPEYGGHLLMPYGWYRRYTGWPATLGRLEDAAGAETGRSWRAEYFSNRSLRGLPAQVESVPAVDFDWGSGGPFSFTIDLPFIGEITLPSGPTNEFSARFTQVRRLRAGWYRFTLRGDDGVRLWVDDRLVINSWKEQSATSYTTEHYVSGGDHVLRVEYFEAQGAAQVRLAVEAIEFTYQLFANTDLSGAPSAAFTDSMTDLEWRHAPPVGDAFSRGRFSLRATGRKHFAAGTYTFHARHTGGCRLWVGSTLVLDDWSGAGGSGTPVAIAEGLHDVKVEFRHTSQIPALDSGTYYRAAVAFDWAETAWTGRLHQDPARQLIADAGWPNVDSIYEGFRVQSLTGDPLIRHAYTVPAPAGTTYTAVDAPTVQLGFDGAASFGEGIPGGGVISNDTTYTSAHFTRRLFVPVSGRYQVTLESDEAFRVTIDGLKVLERRYGGSDPFGTEIELRAGVHDVSIEYADTAWGVHLLFSLAPATWTVDYYSDRSLTTLHSSKAVMGADRIVPERPATLPVFHWSARAKRDFWLPVGRFRLTVRSDDGVRVKANGRTMIDAWKDQPPTTYTAFLEHAGGICHIEIEYYQGGGYAELGFALEPDGFLGEYYRGISLDQPGGSDPWLRNPPHAYRFEPAIDFDWGGSGRLPRVGADRFSARWWGTIELPVGRWQFRLTSDDGVRLFLDDRLLIDRWVDQSASTSTAIVDLAGARRDVRVEYYERSGNAVCKLEALRLF